MTEPRRKAKRAERITPHVIRYKLLDDRIDYESDCYAILTAKGTVLLDPLPLPEIELKNLEPVQAILLSASCHQRASWRYRKRWKVPVYAPKRARGLEEKPDKTYGPGDPLPGGITAVFVPGPAFVHYAFHFRKRPGILFCADLLTHGPREPIDFVPGDYQDDPGETRRSVRKLLRRKFKILCFNHGSPIRKSPQAAIRAALKKDQLLK